jgi:hypothetical protein
MSLSKVSLGGNNIILPAQESLVSDKVTSRLGTGMSLTFFTVYFLLYVAIFAVVLFGSFSPSGQLRKTTFDGTQREDRV